jgi:hypothetical protein
LKSLHKPYLYVDYIRVYKWKETQNNNKEFLIDRRNAINPFIILVSLSIFVVVLIIIAFVYQKLKMNRQINASTHYVVYNNSELIDEQFQIN